VGIVINIGLLFFICFSYSYASSVGLFVVCPNTDCGNVGSYDNIEIIMCLFADVLTCYVVQHSVVQCMYVSSACEI